MRFAEGEYCTEEEKISETVEATLSQLKTRGMLVDGEKAPDAQRERERVQAAEKAGASYDTFL